MSGNEEVRYWEKRLWLGELSELFWVVVEV